MVEKETERNLKCFQTDYGGEYTSNDFKRYCSHHGVMHENIVTTIPQHNGFAERMDRTIVEKSKAQMYATNGYRLYDPEKRKVVRSRDVVFYEHEMSANILNVDRLLL